MRGVEDADRLTHMAGTPKGMRVEARARLIEREGRRCASRSR